MNIVNDRFGLRNRDIIIKTPRMKKERRILNKNVLIDKNTCQGEDADYYERKPYGGKKWIDPRCAYFVDPLSDYRRENENTNRLE